MYVQMIESLGESTRAGESERARGIPPYHIPIPFELILVHACSSGRFKVSVDVYFCLNFSTCSLKLRFVLF